MEVSSDSPATISARLSAWMQGGFGAAFPDLAGRERAVGVLPSSNPDFGDYQCNDAMGLAKVLQQAPRAIAQRVVDTIGAEEAVESLDVAGPGFINVRLKTEWLARYVEQMAASRRLGVPEVGRGQTLIIDYSSPNVAKPMHIGHIRSIDIGNALDRLHRFLGYRVISDNHIGDWGTQFGIIIMGYRHFVDAEAFEASPVKELERLYVKSYERTKTDPEWLAACRAELVKLQRGDPQSLDLWRRFLEHSLAEFNRTYERLGVSFDLTRGESFYRERLAGVVARLEKARIAQESEGATVVFLEEEKLPVCIVRKQDGGFNYATTDLATIASRVEEFEPDRVVYVTDVRQQDHFRQVFAIARRMGCRARLEHVWFGLMRLPQGAISTREGTVIPLDALLDQAEARALELVRESNPDMDPARQREVARAVGIGAVKYADLCQNPQTNITFTWEKALALDGNSAPYLQYAYARVSSVRDKYAERFPGRDPEEFPLVLPTELERLLACKAALFPDVLVRAAQACKPNAVTDYLYDLAQTYSTFYQNVPFLKAEEGLRESRVRLCTVVARTLRQGLSLLGIETPERI